MRACKSGKRGYSRTKRGYMMVEAAIVLPLFILAVLTVGSAMRTAYYEERAAFLTANELSALSVTAYLLPEDVFFPVKAEKMLSEAMPELCRADVVKYRYRFSEREASDLIALELSLTMNTGLPGPMTAEYEGREAFLLRAFCGKDNSGAGGGAQLDREDEYEPVYVFPDWGERYHGEGCSYLHSYPIAARMNREIRRKYEPCAVCKPEGTADGTTVYCFRYGDAYHTGSCNTFRRYAVCMDRADAEAKGYSPCLKCGGK